MTGKYTRKFFVTLAKNKNPTVITTHYFINRNVLVTKTLGERILKDLDYVIKIVNYLAIEKNDF